jgi:predicted short-subunit dehydrogenase-like oxidoreductase (DUF2520 family)
MEIMKIQHVSIAGAGNLAWHLAGALKNCGIIIREVYNRDPGSGKDLADSVHARFVNTPGELDLSVDLIIIAVADSAISEVASLLRDTSKTVVVHTSGSVGMTVLKDLRGPIGVFYPLQTFRKGSKIDFRKVPVCIECNDPSGKKRLLELAGRISDIVSIMNSEERKVLHLAAVFASNFPNFMYTIAGDILRTRGIPFSLLKPLISQTAQGAEEGKLFANQTGPAVRKDMGILKAHGELLESHPEYQEIYNLISQLIIQYKLKDDKL